MGRPLRIEFSGATYHVMSRGVNGCMTFNDDIDRARLLRALRELVRCGRFVVHAYCLMINHFHLLCETPVGMLSRWMQQVLCQHSRCFNRRHDRKGHLWQERYKAILVQDGEYFLECSRYIHLNPVRAGVAPRPEDHQWSSYASYFERASCEWVSRDRTLSCFENSAGYARFLQEGLQRDINDPFKSAVGGIAFGDESFVKRVRFLIQSPNWPDDGDRFGEMATVAGVTPEVVYSAVERLFADLSPCQRGRVLIYCLRRFTGLTGREIASLTGRTASSVSHVWRSMHERMYQDSMFQELCQALKIQSKNNTTKDKNYLKSVS